MSLLTVAARAALLKTASVGRLALAAGGLGAVGAAGYGAASALTEPPPAPEADPAAPAAPLSMRDRLRARLAGIAAGGTGKVLGSWYSASTGKGQQQ